MTPLELKVLLHYHTSPSQFSPTSGVADEATAMFVKEDLLEGAGEAYVTTEKGEYYVRFLLETPFPVVSYSIPQKEKRIDLLDFTPREGFDVPSFDKGGFAPPGSVFRTEPPAQHSEKPSEPTP